MAAIARADIVARAAAEIAATGAVMTVEATAAAAACAGDVPARAAKYAAFVRINR